MYLKFLEIAKRTGVPVKKVLDMFYILQTGKPIENDELLRMVGVSKNALNQIKQALSSFLKPTSRDTQLTPKGVNEVKSLYNKGYMNEETLWSILENRQFQKTLELLRVFRKKKPVSKREYDQFTATLETTARRASLLHFFADLQGKNILFLGDDDFTSVAAAGLKKARNITVVDIDKRILKAIKDISGQQNFEIETIKYDARKSLPQALTARFDIVFTDPPYTPEGIKLFVSRGIEALDSENKAARIYVCYGNSDLAKERFLPIFDILASSGLIIRWVFDKFNRYYDAQTIGSASSLIVCEITPKTKPLIKGDYDKPIYTHN